MLNTARDLAEQRSMKHAIKALDGEPSTSYVFEDCFEQINTHCQIHQPINVVVAGQHEICAEDHLCCEIPCFYYLLVYIEPRIEHDSYYVNMVRNKIPSQYSILRKKTKTSLLWVTSCFERRSVYTSASSRRMRPFQWLAVRKTRES